MTSFTPVHAIVGGVLIALSLSISLIATGRIAGLSGVLAGLVHPVRDDWAWRAWFVLGMIAIGAVFQLVAPTTFDPTTGVSLPTVALAGAFVGVGTRLANGCTSGHGLCGASRGSKRSIVATVVFFGVAVVTATLTGQVVR
jgi:uncharacterized membrane protein YedE/YeeE